MIFIVTAGGTVLVLFVVSYLRTGRFSSTVLALGVGYLLAIMWADDLASYRGVSVPILSWRDTMYSLLILVPAFLALVFSNKHGSLVPRVVQALATSLLVVALLLPVFSTVGQGNEIYVFIESYREILITGLLALGLFDMVFSRPQKAPKHAKH